MTVSPIGKTTPKGIAANYKEAHQIETEFVSGWVIPVKVVTK